ncbi:MAG: hypothetical protein ABIT37_00920 [Luteolibacter sp.]
MALSERDHWPESLLFFQSPNPPVGAGGPLPEGRPRPAFLTSLHGRRAVFLMIFGLKKVRKMIFLMILALKKVRKMIFLMILALKKVIKIIFLMIFALKKVIKIVFLMILGPKKVGKMSDQPGKLDSRAERKAGFRGASAPWFAEFSALSERKVLS